MKSLVIFFSIILPVLPLSSLHAAAEEVPPANEQELAQEMLGLFQNPELLLSVLRTSLALAQTKADAVTKMLLAQSISIVEEKEPASDPAQQEHEQNIHYATMLSVQKQRLTNWCNHLKTPDWGKHSPEQKIALLTQMLNAERTSVKAILSSTPKGRADGSAAAYQLQPKPRSSLYAPYQEK
ncbi:MAG TPA: hypothetical protein VGT41_01315 [Candidatus Babeliales bacterium]|nr:hypothetical protein [Candidatus Babeliales bacterium]